MRDASPLIIEQVYGAIAMGQALLPHTGCTLFCIRNAQETYDLSAQSIMLTNYKNTISFTDAALIHVVFWRCSILDQNEQETYD
jgi:hypothetical protein